MRMIEMASFEKVDFPYDSIGLNMKSREMILPRWLRLREASAYSSIGKHRLIELAKADAVVGFQDPDSGRSDWIFDRFSLDSYREAQATQPTVRDRALDILKGIGS